MNTLKNNDNLLVGVADDTQDFGKLMEDLVSSVDAAASNILPRAEQAVGGVVRLVDGLSDDAVRLLTDVAGYAPLAVDAGLNLMDAFTSGIREHLPELLETGLSTGLELLTSAAALIIRTLGGALLDNVQPLLDAGSQVIDALLEALAQPDSMTGLLTAALSVLTALVNILTENTGMASDAEMQIVTVLGTALLENLPLLLSAGVEIIRSLIGALSDSDALTELLDAGLFIITSLAEILIENLSPLLGAVIAIIGALGGWLGEHALDLVGAGLAIVQAVVDAVIQNLPLLLDAAVQIIEGLCKGIEEDSDDVLIAIEQILRTLLDFLLSPDTIHMVGQAGGKILRALIPAAKELAADLLGFIMYH